MNTVLTWTHVLLFGNVLGNLAIVTTFFRYVRKRYVKQRHLFEQFVDEHNQMYEEFCRRNGKEVNKPRLQII